MEITIEFKSSFQRAIQLSLHVLEWIAGHNMELLCHFSELLGSETSRYSSFPANPAMFYCNSNPTCSLT